MPSSTTSSLAAIEQELRQTTLRLHEVERLLQLFSSHAPAAIAMLDQEMRYLMVSQRWSEDYHLGTQRLIGRSHYEVFPDIPERWKEVHRRCLQGVIERCEEDAFHRLDGRVDYIDWVVAPWYTEGDAVGGLIFFTKVVTEQVEDKRRLQHLHQDLKRSHEQLEAFADAVARGLESLLQTGLDVSQTLIEGRPADDRQFVREQAALLRADFLRMRRLVTGLRDFARVGSADEYHPVDLNEVLATVVAGLPALVADKQALVHYASLPVVQANRFEMLALFQNLIGNAVYYHHSLYPQVQIHVEREAGGWCFRVLDDGPGIPPSRLGAVFDMFRESDLDPTHKGIGITLPVCHRIVEHMQGRMWIEPAAGSGTCVCFTLPDRSAGN
ncbi:MAG: hypothetical protein OHK0039_24750 [Bacteroidia bacterium]